MVAINFQPEFADDIIAGKKYQTIRPTARCKRGDALQLYTGLRTKAAKKILDTTCRGVCPVEIGRDYMRGRCGILFGPDAMERTAHRDGFENYQAMADWFEKKYGTLPFKGFAIEWEKPNAA